MIGNISRDFHALDFDEFRELYLIDEDITQLKPHGKIAKRNYETDRENTEDLNGWAIEIFHEFRRFVSDTLKHKRGLGQDINLYDEFNEKSAKTKRFGFGKINIEIKILKIAPGELGDKYPIVDIISAL